MCFYEGDAGLQVQYGSSAFGNGNLYGAMSGYQPELELGRKVGDRGVPFQSPQPYSMSDGLEMADSVRISDARMESRRGSWRRIFWTMILRKTS